MWATALLPLSMLAAPAPVVDVALSAPALTPAEEAPVPDSLFPGSRILGPTATLLGAGFLFGGVGTAIGSEVYLFSPEGNYQQRELVRTIGVSSLFVAGGGLLLLIGGGTLVFFDSVMLNE